jgi:hypothetical protein
MVDHTGLMDMQDTMISYHPIFKLKLMSFGGNFAFCLIDIIPPELLLFLDFRPLEYLILKVIMSK